jgi:16S rRNA (adenine1518-N6/adenine1519-N6)-dimethyltransferase
MSWNFPYGSPTAIRDILEVNGLAMSKKFGQNFLLSETVREKIVSLMDLDQSKQVWEIGPGIGALTTLLLDSKAEVTCFEIDHGFCRILSGQAFLDMPNFHLVEGDALKSWEMQWKRHGTPDVICGNLPYNVGSVCIANLLEKGCRPERMVYTLQKEVACRLCADPGNKDWSTLSILAQVDYDCRIAMDVSNGAFYPVPKVVSSVTVLEKKKEPMVPAEEYQFFLLVVKDLFHQRRKTVRNNLLSGKSGAMVGRDAVLDSLLAAGIRDSERAEKLEIAQIVELARIIGTRVH